MSKISFNLIIIFLLIAAMASWYFGAYLPLRKSQILILTLQRVNVIKSVEEFEGFFSSAIDFYSPIGQSETVKHSVNTVFNLLNQNNSVEIADTLLKFTSRYTDSQIKNKQGDGLHQLFYILGDLYKTNAFKYKNSDYLNKAQFFYEEGQKLGPKRPQFLYGLLQVYLQKRDVLKANEITTSLLNYWPKDKDLQNSLKNEPLPASF